VKQDPTFNTVAGESNPGIAVDSDGNIYGCYSAGANAFGTAGATQSTSDIFVFKMNASGVVQWTKKDASFNTPVADTVPAIAVDTEGNVCITYQAATGGLAPGAIGGATIGGTDIVVFKLNGSDGSFIWVKQDILINTIADESQPQIITDSENNIYLTYTTNAGTVTGGASQGSRDVVLVKLRPNGIRDWVKQNPTFLTSAWESNATIRVDTTDNIYIAWHGLNTLPANGETGGETATLLGGDNISVVKFDASGNRMWGTQKNIFNTAVGDTAPSIAIDSNGNTYVAYQAANTGVITGGTATGNGDIIVFKLNPDGSTAWTKQDSTISTTTTDTFVSITVDASENPYIAFTASAAISSGSLTGSNDVIIVKLDGVLGTRIWAKQHNKFNTASYDDSQKLVTYGNNLYMIYKTSTTITGRTPTGYINANDIAVAKFIPYDTTTVPSTPVISSASYDGYGVIMWDNTVLNNYLNDGIFIKNYNIYDASNNLVTTLGPYTSSSVFPSSYTVSGLTNGQTSSYYITVENSFSVVSSASNTVSITPVINTDLHVLEWIKQGPTFNTAVGEVNPAIAVDASGNIYGCYASNANSFGSTGSGLATSDIFVFKMNVSGTVLWTKKDASFNTPVNDTVPSIAVDTEGNVCVMYQTAAGGLAPGALGGATMGNNDIVVFKLNGSNGSLIWAKQDSTLNTSASDSPARLITDSSNNIYLGYHTGGTVSGGTAMGGAGDIVLVKLRPDGTRDWVKQDSTINTALIDSTAAIGIDTTGNIYMAWQTQSVIPNSGETATQLTNYNIAVVKFDSSNNGNILWSKQRNIFNTNADDQNASIAIDSNGNTYVAYQANASSDSVVSGGIASGNTDIVVFKLDANGEFVWSKQDPIINTTGADTAVSITVDASGNPYIGYQVPSGGIFQVPGGTYQGLGDIIIIKLNGLTGQRIWAKQNSSFNTTQAETGIKLVSFSNNLYITYLTQGIVPGGTRTGVAAIDTVVAKFIPYNISTPVISVSQIDISSPVTISWSNTGFNYISDGVFITNYRIYDASNNLVTTLGPYTSSSTLPTSYTPSLISGQTYSYYMKVENNLGVVSSASNTVSFGTNTNMHMHALEWVKQDPAFNSVAGESNPAIAVDSAGNIYGCYASGANAFGAAGATQSTADIFVFKMNASGVVQWTKKDASFNTPVADTVPAIAVDTSGNVCIAYNAATGGLAPGATGGASMGNNDIVVFKLDGSDGSLLWAKQDSLINTSGNDASPQIITDSENNIYLTYNVTSGLISGGITAFFGNTDVILIKLKPDGTRLWAQQDSTFNTSSSDSLPVIGLDTTGNIYLAWCGGGTLPNGGETAGQLVINNISVVKFNSSTGARDWGVQKNIFNTNANDINPSIAIDSTGNTYVAYQAASPGVITGGTATGGGDIVVFKLDASGEFVWSKQDSTMNTGGIDTLVSITVDASGNPYIGYQVAAGGIFQVPGGTYQGGGDIIVVKLDGLTGGRIWAKQNSSLNTTQAETGIKLVSFSNNLYITYLTQGIVPGGTRTGSNITDVAIAKFVPYSLQAPQNFFITSEDEQVSLSWIAPTLNTTDSLSPFITYYRIYDASDNLVQSVGPFTFNDQVSLSTTATITSGLTLNAVNKFYMRTEYSNGLLSDKTDTLNTVVFSSSNIDQASIEASISNILSTSADKQNDTVTLVNILPQAVPATVLESVIKASLQSQVSGNLRDNLSTIASNVASMVQNVSNSTVKTNVVKNAAALAVKDKITSVASSSSSDKINGLKTVMTNMLSSLTAASLTSYVSDSTKEMAAAVLASNIDAKEALGTIIATANANSSRKGDLFEALVSSKSGQVIDVSGSVLSEIQSSVSSDSKVAAYSSLTSLKVIVPNVSGAIDISTVPSGSAVYFPMIPNTDYTVAGTTVQYNSSTDKIVISGAQYGLDDIITLGSKSYKLVQIGTLTGVEVTAPGKPVISLTAGNASITVNITSIDNGGSSITGYKYSVDGDAEQSVTTTASSFEITGLTNGTSYSIVVKGVNVVGPGTESDASYATPVTNPSPPTGLSAVAGNGQLTISFTPGDNGGSAVTNYSYSIGTGAFTEFSPATGAVSSVTVTGLTNGTSSSIRLKAITDVGTSTESSSVSGTPVAPNNGGGGGNDGNVPCIVEGQRILTHRGYVKVEELCESDYIITSDGRSITANVYKFTVPCTTDRTAPITIKANAFAPRSPPNDIRLSPLHAIQRSKGVWDIPIKAVKRYENVVQDAPGGSVTYYHIETPNYLKDNLVVEGAVVESFGVSYCKKHGLKATDVYKWSSTLQGYTRTNPSLALKK
jgi:hypothetical protein